MLPGFPNFVVLAGPSDTSAHYLFLTHLIHHAGPNAASGHVSLTFMEEVQVSDSSMFVT